MSRIRVLPDALANRIAAGEVVERPVSIVKELVENSLDAGASRVDVVLEAGGRRLIRVVDDGHGMDRDDAMLAFEQHATSKLRQDDDLSDIGTFGFRGEALAAISACARVTLVTAEADGEGHAVRVADGVLKDVSPSAAPRGTSVEVAGLFSSLPARRKFLRTAATELSHVVRYIEQQALAHLDVHFTLKQERTVLDLPPAREAGERIGQLLGKEFAAAAMHVSGERDGISVAAWLVKSGSGPGRGGSVSFLVNGRVVSDRTLSHAVREAARALYGIERNPAGLVMLTMPARDVDVNVHPAKREVRFSKPWHVHDAVRDIIRGEAFQRGFFGPAVDVTEEGKEGRLASGIETPPATPDERGPDSALDGAAPVPPPGPSPWLHDAREVDSNLSERVGEQEEGPTLPGAIDREGAAPYEAPSASTGLGSGRRVLGQHRNTFIIVEDEQGLVFIDQHCAHERILYEDILAKIEADQPRQALLTPVIVDLPRRQVPVLTERLEALLRLGFEVEPFGDTSFAIRAVPAAAGTADPEELLRELASQDLPGNSTVEKINRLAATIACKAAVKAGFPLGQERLLYIADRLYEAETPTTCPHGRVALLRISDRDLDHRFGRI